MAQDLASLVIGLRADVATLQSDLGKANALNARYAKEAADTWSRAASGISNGITDALRDVAGKIAAAFAVDSLIEFGAKAIETADQLGKMSQKVGVSVESLSSLSAQAKLSNIDTDQLQQGLAKLARNAADAAGGSKESAAAFHAMGLSVKDSNGNLKSTQELLQEVSTRFAGYEDSASKTALAQKLFGKSGADLIPILNQLGEQGFGKATEEAQKYGQVISGSTARQANEFNDNLTKLGLAASGFANAVAREALPALVDLTDKMAESASTSDAYTGSAKNVADAVVLIAENVATLVTDIADLPSEISKSATEFDNWATSLGLTNRQIQTLIDLIPKIPKPTTGGGLIDVSIIPNSPIDKLIKFLNTATLGSSLANKQLADATKPIKDFDNALKIAVPDIDAAGNASANLGQHVDATTKIIQKAKAPIVDNADAAKQLSDALEKLNEVQNKAGQFLAQLAGKVSPADKAMQDYVATIIQAQKISDDLQAAYTKVGQKAEGYAAAQKFMTQAVNGANAALDVQLAKLARQGDIVGRMNEEFAKQAALIGLTDREKAIAEAVQRATDEFEKNTEAGIKNAQTLGEVKEAAAAGGAAIFDMAEKAKNSQDIARQFTSIWVSAGDSIADAFSKWVVEGGSLMKSLTSIAKQVVEQIIAYFMKLAVINPILNAIFGGAMTAGGGSLLPTMMDAGGALFGGGGAGAASASSNASLFGTAQQGYSLFTAGKQMWNGFSTGLSNFWNGSSGSLYTDPSSGLTYNVPGAGSAGYNGSYGGYGSGWGQALGIAGGVYAGYNRYQQAGGGAAGLAGGATYGVGTYALGAGVASAAAGTGFAAGVSGAFAIPVVGWIAAAIMLIDMVSGGKVFGTKGKFNFGEQALTVGASGATVTAGYDLKGQKPLFGGSTHSWQNLPVDPAAQKAADDFFKQLTSQTEAFAKQFGATVGDIVGGQFIATFDKKGNITKTQSTVLGVTYNEDQQHFTERLSAENMIAVLDSLNKGLSAALDQYRADADQLMAVTEALANAESMMQKGTTFLALGSDQSLTALLKLAEGMQGVGETIDQTLQRIEQAQAQYDQFVGQFKPPKNYVDDFEATLAGINDQMNQNIVTANALAKAAGAAGASEQDLANIHQYAARQMAAAIQQLEASAQSLAFNLGLSTTGSLDQVNSEIERLQAKQNAGHAIRDFGQAMQDAAQKAKDAMALLLGSLSPYNDQQKLQFALSGLRSGTTTKDQVLEIGRRLYASSQAYTDLFNQVQSMPTASQNAAGIGGGSGGGLTGAESTRLQMLLKQQQQLQAAAQLQQYQTLAQQIAEIASAKGEDWQQVVKDMGIDLKAFEKGLGMNDQQLNDYITSIQKQTDSDGNNTKSIVDAINAMSDAIVTQLGGTPSHSNNGSTQGTGTTNGAPRGHSSHGRAISDEDAQAIGQSVGRNIRDVVFGNVRNQRTRQTINAA